MKEKNSLVKAKYNKAGSTIIHKASNKVKRQKW